MDNIIDLIAVDAKPSEVSDAIKSALFTKSAEKIDQLKGSVASTVFNAPEEEETEE